MSNHILGLQPSTHTKEQVPEPLQIAQEQVIVEGLPAPYQPY